MFNWSPRSADEDEDTLCPCLVGVLFEYKKKFVSKDSPGISFAHVFHCISSAGGS